MRYRDQDCLVALAGESQWVRNVRAAHGHAAIRRRKTREVRLEELAPSDRSEIIAEYLMAGPWDGSSVQSKEESQCQEQTMTLKFNPPPNWPLALMVVALWVRVQHATYRPPTCDRTGSSSP
jgi:hypothetical protein